MIKFMRSAVVVVACLFAGVGAWGAKVTVTNGGNTYASELFGPGHAAIRYPSDPTDMTPEVVVTIPKGGHGGSAEVTLTISTGTFTSNVTGLMFDPDGPARQGESTAVADTLVLCSESLVDESAQPLDGDDKGCADAKVAPAGVATIMEGGKDGSTIKILIAEAGTTEIADASSDGAIPAGTTPTTTPGTAGDADSRILYVAALNERNTSLEMQTISFRLPRIAGLEALANAAPTKKVTLSATSRVVSGAFTSGAIGPSGPVLMANGQPHMPPRPASSTVISSRDSLTHMISGEAEKSIAIKDDENMMMFKSVKGANADGYVAIGTVTIMTKQLAREASAAVPGGVQSYVRPSEASTPVRTHPYADGDSDGTITHAEAVATTINNDNVDDAIYTLGTPARGATYHAILQLDGEPIDQSLRGTFSVAAMGTRGLFNDGDELFVDYDQDGKMGGGEAFAVDGDMAMSDGLSIDPDESDSFDENGKGTFVVYYSAGEKVDIQHGSTITLTAMVEYSDPSALDEKPQKSTTMLKLDGVTSEVMAYAIPHSTNGTGDKANVRVRCEASAGCRVFLECWDDDGMRNFGDAGMMDGNTLTTWNSAAVEGVIGLEDAASRHSCRILSVGMVTVQQLTRDGNSQTLVNNTYVGE